MCVGRDDDGPWCLTGDAGFLVAVLIDGCAERDRDVAPVVRVPQWLEDTEDQVVVRVENCELTQRNSLNESVATARNVMLTCAFSSASSSSLATCTASGAETLG